jgi:8-oxo-dGTP pyrophosphatase MutT (NUDIX family)
MEPPQYHFGVYARIRAGQRILLVHKTRGPYAGLLDLPGGHPEPGETWPQTLERELQEELGLTTKAIGDFRPFAVHVEESSTGEQLDFHHHGVVLDLPVPPTSPATVVSPDTAGHEWFDLRTGDRARLSSAVRAVLAL